MGTYTFSDFQCIKLFQFPTPFPQLQSRHHCLVRNYSYTHSPLPRDCLAGKSIALSITVWSFPVRIHPIQVRPTQTPPRCLPPNNDDWSRNVDWIGADNDDGNGADGDFLFGVFGLPTGFPRSARDCITFARPTTTATTTAAATGPQLSNADGSRFDRTRGGRKVTDENESSIVRDRFQAKECSFAAPRELGWTTEKRSVCWLDALLKGLEGILGRKS